MRYNAEAGRFSLPLYVLALSMLRVFGDVPLIAAYRSL